MRRAARLVIFPIAVGLLASVGALVTPSPATGAERMWVGFHDDPSYRWVSDRMARVRRASEDGASIVRLFVQWNVAAPQRPSNPTDPFNRTYRLDDVDEAVRAAQEQGQEVMLTISGTPRWANGGLTPNRMPRRLADLRNFARAIAARYSGRYEGFPFVRFWSVWNEPNLQLFLAPQFDARGRSVAPRTYAKLAAAAYAGIKAGSPRAQIAIGETSARGSDKANGLRPTHSPGTFAELVAKANPRLKFDAWSHHPYPSVPSLRPSQVVKWPNVSLASLPRFHTSLRQWFKRKSLSIWITEYGHQTRPEDSLGVPYATQAAYIQQAISLAARYPYVDMFIWFVFQDDQGQPWESGLYTRSGSPKGNAPSRFAASARPFDPRNGLVLVPRGSVTPLVNVHTRRFCTNNPAGTLVGMTWRVFRGNRLVRVGQQTAQLRSDCTIGARIEIPGGVARRVSYTATFALNVANGGDLNRRLTIRAAS